MRLIALLMVLLLTQPARGDCDLSAARLGNQLLKVGDSERKVLEHEPDRTIQLQNRYGAATGIRYDFHLRDKTVQVYVRGGRISRICHISD